MHITLDAGWEQYLRQQVHSGKYPSVDEVVHEALRLMREHEQKLDELRRDITIGIAQADARLATDFDDATLERIKTKARARMQSSP
jgi:antitoxin ParD1/3/4